MLKESELERIGARVAYIQQQTKSEPAIANVDEFLDSASSRNRARRRRKFALTAAGVTASVALLVSALLLRSKDATPFMVEGDPGTIGSWLAASSDNKLQVRFRGGPSMELEPGARARVIDAQPGQVEVLVEHGTLFVTTTADAKSQWRVHAGPMNLTGSDMELTLIWNAVSEVFEVIVHHGRCRATNSFGEIHSLESGQYLRISVSDGRTVLSDVDNRFSVAKPAGAASSAQLSLPGASTPTAIGSLDVPGSSSSSGPSGAEKARGSATPKAAVAMPDD